ncbi:Crp/Fnr family transcriptional regulator [Streptomyces chrestomyceticus]|uniref:Crp/Fnr family transcriptional regulator n=1 Tax=Streptomyces chrestomyceticus TaxID=68185 RepID=A0ABU7X289_9ACTN
MICGSDTNGYTPFLETLPAVVRMDFLKLGRRRHYATGAVLISEGDPADDLLFLHEGHVKVTARLNGEHGALMDIRVGGDAVGEMAIMDNGSRTATVTACCDVVASVIPQPELRRFLSATPEAWPAITKLFCDRLLRATRWRLELRGYPVKVRLARVLVELTVTHGCSTSRRHERRIDVNLTQAEFAALTGSKLRATQEALAQLSQEGLITTGERRTNVLNLEKLRKVALLDVPVA